MKKGCPQPKTQGDSFTKKAPHIASFLPSCRNPVSGWVQLKKLKIILRKLYKDTFYGGKSRNYITRSENSPEKQGISKIPGLLFHRSGKFVQMIFG